MGYSERGRPQIRSLVGAGRLVFGTGYNPVAAALFSAKIGAGALLNGQPMNAGTIRNAHKKLRG